VNRRLTDAWSLSRANLADYILNHLTDPATYCGIVELAH
jgi:hypothetical protein